MLYITTEPRPYIRRWTARPVETDAPRPLPVDLREQNDVYVLTAYVPGLKAEDLNIQILDDTVTIEGEYASREGYALLDELPAGAFRRALRLPTALDAAKAEAHIQDGVLTLRLPKAESVRPRVIKVSAR